MAPKVSLRKINKSTFLKPRMTKETVHTKDRLQYINNETFKGFIPIGPRYQADMPSWSNKFQKEYPYESKWLSAKVWKTKHATPTTVEEYDVDIGKGRPDFCSYSFSGSAECVKLHIRENIIKLMSDLGPAYKKWKFHKMSDMLLYYSWNLNKQKKFQSLVTICNV
ncbi:hypothetical protein AgCh_039151 [Apium graveolens]